MKSFILEQFKKIGFLSSFNTRTHWKDTPIDDFIDVSFFKTKTNNKYNILLSGAVHGDEPVGTYALLDFFLNHANEYLNRFNFYVIPCVNSYGFENNKANNKKNINLNRSFFDGTKQSEAEIIIQQLKIWKTNFLFAMDIHEIPNYWEDEGWKKEDNPNEAYLYETQNDVNKRIGRKILDSVDAPLCQWPMIYGDVANNGLISYPEACGNEFYAAGTSFDSYVQGRYSNHTFTTETPTSWSLEERARIQVGWIKAALDNVIL